MDDLTLRPSSAADAEFIYALNELTLRPHVEAMSRKWAGAKMRDKCANDAVDPNTRIVSFEGIDCGVYTLEIKFDEIFLHSMLLEPGSQRRGIGRHLLQQALEEAETRRLPIRLFVMRANPAKGYYERFGFRVFDEAEQYFAMERSPIQSALQSGSDPDSLPIENFV